MALKLSTALRNSLLAGNSLQGSFASHVIRIYSGTEPADADASLGSAVLLCTITKDGSTATNGTESLTFNAPASGVLSKLTGSVWQGVNGATGVATFYRHVSRTDTGAALTNMASTANTECRIQGSIATAGAELNLSNTTLTSGATQTIDYYTINLPSF